MILSLLPHAESERAQPGAQTKVLPVCVSGQSRPVKVQLARAVQQLPIGIDADDLGQEHLVTAQRERLPDLAREAQRGLHDARTLTPQLSTARTMRSSTRLMTNSPLSRIRP